MTDKQQQGKPQAQGREEEDDKLIQRFADLVDLPEVIEWNKWRNELYELTDNLKDGFKLCFAAGKAVGEYDAKSDASQPSSIPTEVQKEELEADMYDEAMFDVIAEVRRAKTMFKENFHNQHEGYAVILEEIDELWDEVKKNQKVYDISAQRKEAIQCAAMCIRFIAELTRPASSAPPISHKEDEKLK